MSEWKTGVPEKGMVNLEVRLPTHSRPFGAVYSALSNEFRVDYMSGNSGEQIWTKPSAIEAWRAL